MSNVNSNPLILNGREVQDEVLKNIRTEINNLKAQNKRLPGLAVVLVGDNPASHTYVKNKEKTCRDIGLYSEVHKLKNETQEDELIKLIDTLNADTKIDGILIQLPLPVHIDAKKIINNLDPKKDVDGLHPTNLGKLLSGQDCLKPCTPQGVIAILKYYSINISGLHAVIIGRSTLVGKPLSLLLLNENASVTITHSKTNNLDKITSTADILVCAIGKPNLVKKHWVKPDAIVIDIGINKNTEGNSSKLTGDVDFKDVISVCRAITPTPGGVGPVTIAMLMTNTLEAYRLRNKI